MEGVTKFTQEERFLIGPDQIYGNFTYYDSTVSNSYLNRYNSLSNSANYYGVTNPSLYYFQKVGGLVVMKFKININLAPNTNVKRVVFKHINTALTTAGGYIFELRCPEILRTPINFLDSTSVFGAYAEYPNASINLNPEFTLVMRSGEYPTAINNPPTPNANNTTDELGYFTDGLVPDEFISNPFIGFTLEYEYL